MILDIIVLIILVSAFVAGYKRGIIFMVFFFVGLFIGVIAALKFSSVTAEYLVDWFNINGPWLPVLAMLVTFGLVFALVRWLAKVLEGLLKMVFLNFFNKVIGGALGAGIAFISVSVLLWYASGFGLFGGDAASSSQFLPLTQELAPGLIAYVQSIIPFLGDLLENIKDLFEEVTNEPTYSTPENS